MFPNDWDVFMDTGDFADSASWETQEGEFADLEGIFQETAEAALDGVSAVLPVLTVAESAIPATAAQGDDLEVRGRNYRVSDIQPDGSGMARVILERT